MTEAEKTTRRALWARNPTTFAPLAANPQVWQLDNERIAKWAVISVLTLTTAIITAGVLLAGQWL